MPAEFAEASYILNDKQLNKQDRIDKANEKLSDTGYQVHPDSGRDVQLFVHSDGKKGVIAHRGTDFNGNRAIKDVRADLAYMTGNETVFSKEFSKRASKTKKILKKIDPNMHITMTGHSLGGASVNHSLLKEPDIRNRVDNVELYNPLLHHAGSSKVHTKRHEHKKDVDDQLNNLITIHRTKNDLASDQKPQHGKVKNYKQKFHSTRRTNPFRDVFDKVEQLSAHSLRNFL